MARIYQVLQRKGDGRYDMTVSSDEEGWSHPVGYCADFKEMTEEELDAEEARGNQGFRKWYKDQLQNKDKYHSGGHATKDEAYDCYTQYILDNRLRFWEQGDTQKKCEVCDCWTTGRGELNTFKQFILCADHQQRDIVEGLLKKRREEAKTQR